MTPVDIDSDTYIASLLWEAVDLLGAIALRKRTRLSRREAYRLEDGLFSVLEKLNDLKVKAPEKVGVAATVVADAVRGKGVRRDGTA